MSWREGIVYQVYPRSFQDSDDDGVGDLAGITRRLDHLAWLGVDALWISPFYPSPLADFGYDVSDYTDVDPIFGSLPDFDRLVAAAHERDLKVLVDLVACHTSIQHPWFRDHPDWYVWAKGDRPPNNWTSAFGGPAWTRYDSEHWYLHSFYPEQADLDWRKPEVVMAMQEVVRFWVARGADGFRLDAIDRLAKDPELRDDPPSEEPFGLPLLEHELGRDLRHSRNAAGIGDALSALRDAAGDALLIGEIYLPAQKHAPYLEHLDRAFVFELIQSPWEESRLRTAITAGAALEGRGGAGASWALSNHDFGRYPWRFGREHERAAAMLLMTLPGTACLYQGDEIGQGIGPGTDPPYDRVGRDVFRHPMQWEPEPRGGFTTAEPWLPVVDPEQRSVAAQRAEPDSLLHLFRELISLRRDLAPGLRMVDPGDGLIAYERGDVTVAIGMGSEPVAVPGGEVLLATSAAAQPRPGLLAPREGVILAR